MNRYIFALILITLQASNCCACSIPVFRYALERWTADLFEISVYHDGPLTGDAVRWLDRLEDEALHNGGTSNYEVVRCDLQGKIPADLQQLWKSLSQSADGLGKALNQQTDLPYVVVRSPRERSGQRIVWRGRLSDVYLQQLSTSPARQEIVTRLLRGDSVVWLLIKGTDTAGAKQAHSALQSTLKKLQDEIPLPAGIGKPGSELHAKVPLRVQFSTIEIDGQSSDEQSLMALIQSRFKQAPLAAESLAVPVFGRGRALEVLRSTEIEPEAIQDLTEYLCGACSCQVKQQNPGFDLLLGMNWEDRLFDPGFEIPSDMTPESDDATTVAIPRGHAAQSDTLSNRLTPALNVSVSTRYVLTGYVALLFCVVLISQTVVTNPKR